MAEPQTTASMTTDGILRLTAENRQSIAVLKCPTCAADLKEVELGDVFLVGLRCREGHGFFIATAAPNAAVTEKAHGIQGSYSSHAMESEIIHAWLTEEGLRRYLNTQLAVTLRRIAEVGVKPAVHAGEFRLCPFCTGTLAEDGTDQSGWSGRYVCPNGHIFYLRSGLYWKMNGQVVDLCAEFDDEFVMRCAKFYLRDDIRSNVPADVRRILMTHLNVK
ncbi:MAG TPA: hypothetical protein VN706_10960 [Gemmatimonadaceae bacterium]|nr:hypothetical protein [Gemmatimonadaceae bacterium]